jgi:hypothetical protein
LPITWTAAHLVKNIRGKQLRGDTAREVLDALASVAALDGSIITVCLGIGFLQQREPRLVLVLTLGEEQRLAVGLIGPPVLFLRVGPVDLLP